MHAILLRKIKTIIEISDFSLVSQKEPKEQRWGHLCEDGVDGAGSENRKGV